MRGIYHTKLLGTFRGSKSHIIPEERQHLCTPHCRKENKRTTSSLENSQSHLKRSSVATLNTRDACREGNAFPQRPETWGGAFLSHRQHNWGLAKCWIPHLHLQKTFLLLPNSSCFCRQLYANYYSTQQ